MLKQLVQLINIKIKRKQQTKKFLKVTTLAESFEVFKRLVSKSLKLYEQTLTLLL